jgi:putative two-component system response regulator
MIDAGDAAQVLVIDDDPDVGRLLERLLVQDGYAVRVAPDAAAARARIAQGCPDVVVLDVVLPDSNGVALCRGLKEDAATRLTPVILVTGYHDEDIRLQGLAAGADDFLTKPINTRELLTRVRALARLKRYTDDLDAAGSIITTLATMIEARDGHTEGHCHRMANYATALGRALGLGSSDLQTLQRGGFLHDIGMLAIPDSVLRKTGPLDPDEYVAIKSHTVIGDRLCANLRSLQPVRPIVRHHHERYDGSGYPDGLTGDRIPLLAQIIGVVDVYDAVTTQRPYQQAQSSDEAIRVLRTQAGCGWRRRDLVEAFAAVVTRH